MRKILFVLLTMCICSYFTIPDTNAQTAQVINAAGGFTLNDGLKIQVNLNGALAVYRMDQTQYYYGYPWSDTNNRTHGVTLTFRFSSGAVYNSSARTMTACSTTPVEQVGNTYTTSVTGYVNSPISTKNFYVTMNVTYTYPNHYFLVDYYVRAPSDLPVANPETVHLYLDHDAYILGSDNSKGYQVNNATGHFVGDFRLTTDVGSPCHNRPKSPVSPSTHGFKTRNGFRSYYSGLYSSRNTINALLELTNTINTTCVDDGIAVEFTIGPLSAGQTAAKQVLHGYGNNQGEFDNTVVNDPAISSGPSSAVTVNLTSATYSEQEGNTSHPTSAVQVVVSGGSLAQSQVCNFTVSGGSAIANTDYSYVKGFTIPAGDYTTPKTLTLNNITIIGNTVCQNNRTFNISIDPPGNCNDLILRGTTINQATFTIEDDEARPEITTNLPDLEYYVGQTVPAITLASDVSGATISWTNTNTSIGLAASGNGNIPSFTATNTTSSDITATITVTASSAGSCTGTPKSFLIKVIPRFTITYNYNNGTAPTTPNPTDYLFGTGATISNEPTRLGYTFAGWTCAQLSVTTPQKPFTIPTTAATNVTLVADWGLGADLYTITYNLNGGTIPPPNTNPDSYDVNTTAFTLKNPEKAGYNFTGWTGTGISGSSSSVTVGPNATGNRSYTATWSAPLSFAINYDYNLGTAPTSPNKASYNIEEVPFTINTTATANQPTRSGYTFTGWTGQDITTATQTINVTTGSFSTTGIPEILNYTAQWTTDAYTISYTLNGGTVNPANPTGYDVTTPTFTLNNPTRDGYTFAGWTGTGISGSSTNVSISLGSTGNRSYVATWTPINYNITYVDSDGTTPITAPGAPTQYNDTQTPLSFTSTPAKSGYTFVAWSGTGASGSSITIPDGTLGALTYQASWTANAYTITYDPNNGTNPTIIPAIWLGYDMDDLPINNISVTPTRDGYNFNGWSGHGLTNQTTPFNITSSTTGVPGNLTYTAQWSTPITYTITYNLNLGTVNPANPTSYNVTTPTFTLNNPTRLGYTFAGWIGSNGSTAQLTVTITKGTTGNLSYEATWTTDQYTISYDHAGGNAPAIPNPSSYDVTDLPILLNNPTRNGYTFAGWTGTGVSTPQNPYTIPGSTTGNLSYLANWTAINYNISYVDSDGTTPITAPGAPATYNDTDTPLSFSSKPAKSGYTFIGWTGTGASGANITIPTGTLGALTYIANWSTDAYTITFDLNGGESISTIPPNWQAYDVTQLPINGVSVTPTRLGYTFKGWDGHGLSGETNPFNITTAMTGVPGNLTFTAGWDINNYTINYDPNDPGASIVPGNPISYTIVQARSLLYVFQDPVHLNPKNVFLGWTCQQYPAQPMQLVYLIPSTSTGDLNFVAHWSKSLTDLNPTNLNDTIIFCEGPKTLYGDPAGKTWTWIYPDGNTASTRNINTDISGRYICRTDYGTLTVADTLYTYFISTPSTEIRYITTTGAKVDKPQQFVIDIPTPLLPFTTTTWNVGDGSIVSATTDSLTVIWHNVDEKRVTARIDFSYAGVTCSKTLIKYIQITDQRFGLFVDQHVFGGNNDGTSWANAFKTIQEALSHTVVGDYVWVAQGEYSAFTDQSFEMNQDSVEIYGGFAAVENYLYERNPALNPTIMKGSGNKPVVHIQGAEIRLDGFTIQGGKGVDGAGISFAGGGTGTIANCIIKENTATGKGGGVFVVAPWFGYDPTRFINTEISGNQAAEGAGIYNVGSEFLMLNSTVSGNKAATTGGVHNLNGNPEIQNSIIWGNITSNGNAASKNMANENGNPVYSYSIIGGSGGSGSAWISTFGTDGTHNKDASPMFVRNGYESDEMTLREGNYRLASSSPASNQGYNFYVMHGVNTPWDIELKSPKPSYVESLLMDLDYKERISFDIVDMGAYEYGSISLSPMITREVVLSEVGDMAVMNPGAGDHYIKSEFDFVFTLTMNSNYVGQRPVVTTTRTSIPDSEGVEIVKTGENTYTVTIHYIQENIIIYISFVTGNVNLSAGNIWTFKGDLHVVTEKTASVLTIYNFAGQLFKQQQLTEGETIIAMPQGTYIVTLDDGAQQKILIKP